MTHGRQASHFGRLAKVEFPRFQEDDVRGWVFRCDQFFNIDNTPNDEKVKIVYVHLSDKALLWHRQYIIINGQLFSLVLIPDEEDCFEDCLEEESMKGIQEMPQIS
ncbi:hypothetical protein Tco_0869673 [Tanacetum coccineum]